MFFPLEVFEPQLLQRRPAGDSGRLLSILLLLILALSVAASFYSFEFYEGPEGYLVRGKTREAAGGEDKSGQSQLPEDSAVKSAIEVADSSVRRLEQRAEQRLEQRLDEQFRRELFRLSFFEIPDYWLFRDEFRSGNSHGAALHLKSFLSRPQPAHARFVASRLSFAAKSYGWLENSRELRQRMLVESLSSDKADQEKLRERFSSLAQLEQAPGGAENENVLTDKQLRDKFLEEIDRALQSDASMISWLEKLRTRDAVRCRSLLMAVNQKIAEESGGLNPFYDFPDTSYYSMIRAIASRGTGSSAGRSEESWIGNLLSNWQSEKLPSCLEGGRYDLIGRLWICSEHRDSQSTAEGLDGYESAIAELFVEYYLCHPDEKPEGYFPRLDPEPVKFFHRKHPDSSP